MISPANKVNIHTINPKAINIQELYGFYKEDQLEWIDGVLTKTLK